MKFLIKNLRCNFNGKSFLTFLVMILPGMVSFSCIDDNTQPEINREDNEELVRVEFKVPNIDFGDGNYTRADDNNNLNQEGWMANLYLVILKDPVPDEERNLANIYELDTSGYNPQIGNINNFYVNLYSGHNYKFYLLANFDRYLSRFAHVSDVLNEKQVKDLVLNFTPDAPLVPSHLPMAARPEDFSMDGVTPVDGILNIEKSQVSNSDGTTSEKKIVIKADMKFQCAKVRYTILYNNTVGGCSQWFGNNSIRFIVNQSADRPKAKFIRKQTRFFSDRLPDNFDSEFFFLGEPATASAEDATDEATVNMDEVYWTLELNRYKFPVNDDGTPNENYPASSTDKLELWEDKPNLVGWKASKQRAWQGIVYLPENDVNAENEVNKSLPSSGKKINEIKYFTKLIFPYVLEKYIGEDGSYQDADLSSMDSIPEKEFSLFGNDKDIHYAADYQTTGQNEVHGLQRGYFYDAVAIVKYPEPDDLEMYIQVYVGDHPWIYHNNGSQEW